MKKIYSLLLILNFTFLISNSSRAQVICVLCFDQNDSISTGVNNLIQNGGFENGCTGTSYFCPNSTYYNCDFANWTCTGGGINTYAHNADVNFTEVIQGTQTAYLGNFYASACSANQNDTSCVSDTDCTINPLPPGYPTNTVAYGGTTGLSLSQTVTGLTIGNVYVLEFWAGGEGSSWPNRGLFGVDVGFGDTLLRCRETSPFTAMVGTRYIIEFAAVSTSHTIKFTNWGHICADCTELILDDVRLYTLAELSPSVAPCAGLTPVALFNAPNHICPGTCTNFTNLSMYATSYVWTFAGANPFTSTDENPTNICYNTPGSYSVSLISSNSTGSDTITLNNFITVYPYPAPQGIAQSGDTLFANTGAISYQWYHAGNIIPGATNYFYVADTSGDFNVVATDNHNCEVEAAIFDVVASSQSSALSPQSAVVFPNPVEGELKIKNEELRMGTVATISIYNMLGVLVTQPQTLDLKPKTSLDVRVLPKGMYWLELSSDQKTFRTKFVKQ